MLIPSSSCCPSFKTVCSITFRFFVFTPGFASDLATEALFVSPADDTLAERLNDILLMDSSEVLRKVRFSIRDVVL